MKIPVGKTDGNPLLQILNSVRILFSAWIDLDQTVVIRVWKQDSDERISTVEELDQMTNITQT